jgi:hypothetical protein
MSNDMTQMAAFSDLGELWFRDQLARLVQKHLQVGQHCRMDTDGMLARLADRARAAKVGAIRDINRKPCGS